MCPESDLNVILRFVRGLFVVAVVIAADRAILQIRDRHSDKTLNHSAKKKNIRLSFGI